ncbi:hypothetical protein BCU70_07830 [Vibrio sp. 10N.286.49.C2]|uniref:hypothetical protein n=1 Tax=unclassified Vibrio TaxID=2614977 RepID=UPI000C81A8FC|nr:MULTISPECIES: hypothetical protein [unclassified Vibrio]PMH29547.1 hypothetical protein BCU70_07830 [Vibrio sp. 10N.286.49.C2]PMH56062.1 hypothetical protein BCU66_07740 [Vibrio sp. 10N.286.49.B1]PMH77677.1 hypothetical protein BCU58_12310 [Vibrio sp. 10N.286.48.B7]
MKKTITTIALAIVLGGCSSSSVMDNDMWIAKDTAMVEQQAISLSANLWIDMMPKIGETQPLMKEQMLHGALNLSTESQLPADMDAVKVVLRQDGETWTLDSEDFELRNHSEEQWEIAFKWQLAFNNSKPMDVAVLLVNSDKEIWLTNQQVMVDTVY